MLWRVLADMEIVNRAVARGGQEAEGGKVKIKKTCACLMIVGRRKQTEQADDKGKRRVWGRKGIEGP